MVEGSSRSSEALERIPGSPDVWDTALLRSSHTHDLTPGGPLYQFLAKESRNGDLGLLDA